ncbi:hypothetical protein [Sporomusa sp.]|uniref:hypothetical protein n=1 Tax=Sporomusa sp. TaxID=2078658 RepID=UPI002CEEA6D1|nr:hypothetical protein [Sporomusa sp.]HWR45451.1 hypothetical protein [Sporomusa sp.]
MSNNHYLVAALALGLLVIGSTRGVAVTTAIDWQLPGGYQIFDMQEGDVTGDGTHDRVYLIGHKPSEASNYADSIRLIVENGADQTRTEMALEKMGGYEAQLFLGDFTGDHVADALVTAASGGSGGWYDNKVVTFTQEAPIIFSHKENSGNSVSGQFIDGYKVEIYNAAGGSAVTLDVGERKADYTRLGLYDKSGVLKKQTKIMVTPFGKLEPVDVNNDGIYELKGQQRISGAYNADGLANVETVLSYTGNDWQARSVSLRINLLPPKTVKPTVSCF